LRGKALVDTALRELSDTASWAPPHAPLTWERLAARLGVSRQAVATKSQIKDAFARSKAELSRWSVEYFKPAEVVKRTLEDKVAALELEVKQLKSERDGWIEKWVQVEVNARRHGIDADLLFQPLAKPVRR
jgi:hypothetical protein